MLKVPFHYVSKLVERLFKWPLMQKMSRKYPRLFHFLQQRFDPGHFFGLPFTLVLLLFWVNMAMLSEIAENLINSEGMKAIDGWAANAFYSLSLRTPMLTWAAVHFTELGSVPFLTLITFLAGFYLLLRRKWYYLLTLLISVLGNGTSVYLIKNYFHRERPGNIASFSLTTYSFPSGHAAGAFALEGFLFYLLILNAKNRENQLIWLSLGFTYIVLIGLSRLYLGVHFLSDVIGGYSLGFLWLLFAIVCLEYLSIKTGKKEDQHARTPKISEKL